MDEFLTTLVNTPLGKMLIQASLRGLQKLDFVHDDFGSNLISPKTSNTKSLEHLETTKDWLTRYFLGKFNHLPSIAVDFAGTDFEIRVWRALLNTPFGSLDHYGKLAQRIGSPGAARAVGSAVGRNPIAIIVPCHRIIGSNQTLTGYSGGLKIKKWLLEHEGFRVLGASKSSLVTTPTK